MITKPVAALTQPKIVVCNNASALKPLINTKTAMMYATVIIAAPMMPT
jgi:hypothetical protein